MCARGCLDTVHQRPECHGCRPDSGPYHLPTQLQCITKPERLHHLLIRTTVIQAYEQALPVGERHRERRVDDALPSSSILFT
ncbi:uncharacterized protein YALI1_C16648g [Yarrowia lipolytica]|uniref:Uncharacterized protein n=1 Tax=Yarrowia lipolytica TaxID=4952 RepID=A0A1D8NAR3_YARLL|nr:hypothetical protein YALI1_C16648g [Yarrowia lipolytica]